jgi:RNA-directed DNA polymerase
MQKGMMTVNLEDATRQKARQLELLPKNRGEAPTSKQSGEATTAGSGDTRLGTDRLMEEVVQRENARAAFQRVRQNKGSPGIDRMTVDDLPKHLAQHWPGIREQLLAGTYQPSPVRRQEIPKSGGGTRALGIPTVLDRFIQQAILQVLQPRFDPTFSEHSHGFRPGRSAHDAVREAEQYIREGRGWVVDVDLEKFFDRVNHDVLMGKLSKRISDKRMLGLIRRYLGAGVMANGVVVERVEGTPQGGPLSPLLAKVLLDEVDKELERRGHAFVRYADDCNVYVGSRRAGDRVMEALRHLYAKLQLRINESKSAVARPQQRTFLGYRVGYHQGVLKPRVAPQSLRALRDRLREITSRKSGRSMAARVNELRTFLRGWRAYFQLSEQRVVFRQLDTWIRSRLRAVQLKQWKNWQTVFRELRARGVPERSAAAAATHSRSWWRTAHHPALLMALPNSYYAALGIPSLYA